MNYDIIYNDTNKTDNNNNSIIEQNDSDIYGMNSILIGISEKDRNRKKSFNINQNNNKIHFFELRPYNKKSIKCNY